MKSRYIWKAGSAFH